MASSCGEVTRWQPESGRADSMFPFVNPELGFCIQKKNDHGDNLAYLSSACGR